MGVSIDVLLMQMSNYKKKIWNPDTSIISVFFPFLNISLCPSIHITQAGQYRDSFLPCVTEILYVHVRIQWNLS